MLHVSWLLTLVSFVAASPAPDRVADSVDTKGNNTLFNKWRPTSRFIAPAGWMNDPCGAMYDAIRDEFYQFHPNHVSWGNISWGHAISKDLITWKDVPHQGTPAWRDANAEALGPTGNGSYNGLGIFSGSAQPVNLQGQEDGTLLIFYTSVSHLPLGWNTSYIPGTETQSMAMSTDGGRTWHEHANNPVIKAPPPGWDITGWRDPFFEPWPEMDTFLGQSEPHYYAVFGSGIRGVGPRMPLYSAPARDLTNWTFLGALWEPKANTSFGSMMATGNWAYNFEVANFFSLKDDDGSLHYFATMSTEGGSTTFHPSTNWALYNEGVLTKRTNGSVAFSPVSGSALDWGLLYAQTTFIDRKNKNRRVQWGWAREELPDGDILKQQGFQGAFALPRELFAHVTKGLLDPDGLLQSSGACVTKASDGTYTASVLGIRPLDDVVQGIRKGSRKASYAVGRASSSLKLLQAGGSMHMELSATIHSIEGQVGFIVAASGDGEEQTIVYFDSAKHTVVVDRSSSTTAKGFRTDPVIGYFYPYTLSTGPEDLHIRIFIDGSLLEVYINDRFALTTRIYPTRSDSTGFGPFVGLGASAVYENIHTWMDTMNIWPERPLNSSSRLVFDTPEQTNDYMWWVGD